ncbi:MAG: D-tyrosyl-tRNA(Tyr) deacylase [Lachnospiraceae bacterium]|nr:D-tyrosyl-tRNA(Tyr) deacylase [Lachnospiraceae bacterium]
MKFMIQRVTEATVTSEGKELGSIGKGFVVLISVADTDTLPMAEKMVNKMTSMRIFEDENGKTNLSLKDVDGSLLLVSQFTLYANCKKGNRPSFIEAGSPEFAEDMYNKIIDMCKEKISNVQTGSFGADMQIALVNDGPFTIMLDSDVIC